MSGNALPNLSTLEYLLRIYWSPNEHPDAPSEPWERAITWLRDEGLIEPSPPCGDDPRASSLSVTPKGRAFIEHIRGIKTPHAETIWRVENPKDSPK